MSRGVMMAVEQSMWRVNDIVAYDVMRELAVSVQARLVERVREGDVAAHDDLIGVRRATEAVDGYDRAAVDQYTRLLQLRDAELAVAAPSAD